MDFRATYEKVKHTFFKKGHLPHNTLTDYTEVIRNEKGTTYIYIKIPGARKAIPKHRYLWEQAHGTIPKGYNIIFKFTIFYFCFFQITHLIIFLLCLIL